MSNATLPRVVHPNKLEHDGHRVTVGPRVYALLDLVVSAGGSVTWSQIGRSVFGEPIADRGKVDVLVHRCNAKLEGVRCPLRLAVERERVVLL